MLKLPKPIIKKILLYNTKHDNTKHDNTKHDNTKHDNTKHDNTKHDNTKHDNTKHDNTKHDNTKHDNTKHDNTKHDNTKHDNIKNIRLVNKLFNSCVYNEWNKLLAKCNHNKLEIIKTIIRRGYWDNNVLDRTLLNAIKFGNWEIIKFIINKFELKKIEYIIAYWSPEHLLSDIDLGQALIDLANTNLKLVIGYLYPFIIEMIEDKNIILYCLDEIINTAGATFIFMYCFSYDICRGEFADNHINLIDPTLPPMLDVDDIKAETIIKGFKPQSICRGLDNIIATLLINDSIISVDIFMGVCSICADATAYKHIIELCVRYINIKFIKYIIATALFINRSENVFDYILNNYNIKFTVRELSIIINELTNEGKYDMHKFIMKHIKKKYVPQLTQIKHAIIINNKPYNFSRLACILSGKKYDLFIDLMNKMED